MEEPSQTIRYEKIDFLGEGQVFTVIFYLNYIFSDYLVSSLQPYYFSYGVYFLCIFYEIKSSVSFICVS